MKIQFNFLGISKKTFKPDAAIRWIEEIIATEGKQAGEITFVITSDDHLLEINKKYLKHNYFTDVISFGERRKNQINGDVYISHQRVRENAVTFGITFHEELLRVMVHGILHLMGYEDEKVEKKKEMTRLEDNYIKLGIEKFAL